jgi:hypothetical protein
VPWFLQNFFGVDGWGLDGWFLFSISDYFCILSGFYICLSWWSILLIERYLVAKIGTTSWFRCGGSSSLSLIMRDWSGFITFLVVFINKCFHHIGMVSLTKFFFFLSFGFSCCNADWARYHVNAA